LLTAALCLGLVPAVAVSSAALAPPITVTLSYQQDNTGFPIAPKQISLAPGLSEQYGYPDNFAGEKATALDAIVAAHILIYGENKAAVNAKLTVETSGPSAGMVTNFMGDGAGNFTFFVDGALANDGAMLTEIPDGSAVELFAIQDTTYWSDTYTWFEVNGKKVSALQVAPDESFDLTLRGIEFVIFGAWGADGPKAIEDAVIVTMLPEEGAAWIDDLADVTDGNGAVTLSFHQRGTYILSAIAEDPDWDSPLMSPYLVVTVSLPPANYQAPLTNVLNYLRTQVTSPLVSEVGGEWAVLAEVRGGRNDAAWNSAYLANLETYIRESAASVDTATGKVVLHNTRYTENARAVLALTSLGVNAASFKGYDLVSALLNTAKLQNQGVAAVAFALTALDSGSYLRTAAGEALRHWCIDYLLTNAKATGGWHLSPAVSVASPDITGMALQALAPYYKEAGAYRHAETVTAVEKAVAALQTMQAADGSFSYEDNGKTTESAAQVLVALTALDYDGTASGSFLKSVAEILLTYQAADGGFRHGTGGSADQMASEQAACALVAYDRYVTGKTALYDTGDISKTTVPPTDPGSGPAPTWLDKLPTWLSGIRSLKPWMQWMIHYIFFGWIWEVL
jgi:hypothetical protein